MEARRDLARTRRSTQCTCFNVLACKGPLSSIKCNSGNVCPRPRLRVDMELRILHVLHWRETILPGISKSHDCVLILGLLVQVESRMQYKYKAPKILVKGGKVHVKKDIKDNGHRARRPRPMPLRFGRTHFCSIVTERRCDPNTLGTECFSKTADSVSRTGKPY